MGGQRKPRVASGGATAAPTGANSSGSGSTIANAAGAIGSAANIYGGVQRGGVAGYGSAAAGATQLGAKYGAFGSNSKAFGNYAGGASNILGIYSGLKQGGAAGYSNAAVSGAALGARAGAFGGYSGAVGKYAGYAAIPLAVYDFAKNGTASGRTGSDAATGAMDGAAIGTAIMPGIGTVVGGVIGGAAGAIASAFGNGAVDPENANFNSYTDAYNKAPAGQQGQVAASVQNPYLPLAGYFDLRSNQLKGSNPLYQAYGRKGEAQFTTDMVGQINKAVANGTVSKTDSPQTVYNKVVNPWINSFGNWQDSNKNAMQGLLQQMTQQFMTGQAGSQWRAIGGDAPFKNLTGP